jgi:hypothetical protein
VFSQKKFKFCVQAYSPPSRPYCLDPFTYRPYAHAEAGPRQVVGVPPPSALVRDVCGSLAEPRGAYALATPRRPSATIGSTAAACRRSPRAVLQPCRGPYRDLATLTRKKHTPPPRARL